MADRSLRNMCIALLAFLVGLSGCASGGGGGAAPDGGALDVDALMAEARDIEQGESPRDTQDTDAAADALDDGEDADDPAEARTHYQRALTSAQAAIAEDPRNPLGHRLAALANLFLENYQDAGEHFDHAEELRPIYQFEDVSIREAAYIEQYQLASPLLSEGAYEEASVNLENASAVYGARPEADITLAQIYASLRQHDQAIEKMEEVDAFLSSAAMEDIDEETATNWRSQAQGFPLMKAQVLADAGRFEEATVAYRGLVAANPDDIDLQQDLGAILMQMGDTEEALQVYTTLLTLPGMDSDGLSRIGLGFYQAGQYGEAAGALEQAVEVSPMDRDALEWWARSLRADSAFAEVPAVIDRWVALDPQSQQGFAMLAEATNMNGDARAAADAIGRVQALEFSVNDLQMRRSPGVGADISGSVSNRSLAPGSQVTLVFTFFAESGTPLGTVIRTVAVGAEGMNELFELRFDTAELVGGYGYEVGG